MKSFLAFMIIMLAAMFFFTSCMQLVSTPSGTTQAEKRTASPEAAPSDTPEPAASNAEKKGNTVKNSYGIYTVPDGWVVLPGITTDKKTFYGKENIDYTKPNSNISVECGTNRYKESEHMVFKDAILRQLLMQAQGNASVEGSGTSTEKGYILYIFTITYKDEITDVQYYIVGEKRYFFVHVTDFKDIRIPDVNEVAAKIADSFVWS